MTPKRDRVPATDVVALPPPRLTGDVSVEQAMHARRSVRAFAPGPLSLADVSQLVWAGQGITADGEGLRTAPSAGALYPLEILVATGELTDLSPGVYRYRPQGHDLLRTADGDIRSRLAAAALGQSWMRGAPAIIAIAAVYSRTTGKYGERGKKYVHAEIGHAAQNICLEAVALGLGSVIVGAFEDASVKTLLGLAAGEHPHYLIPVGRPD